MTKKINNTNIDTCPQCGYERQRLPCCAKDRALSEAYAKGREDGIREQHHVCCNYPNRQVGTCNCKVVMKGETYEKGYNEAVMDCKKIAENYPCEEIREWKFQDEIAEQIGKLKK